MIIQVSLDRRCRTQQHFVIEPVAHELNSNRQTFTGRSSRDRNCGAAGQIGQNTANIGKVHGQWILAFLPKRKCRKGRNRAKDHVEFLKKLPDFLFHTGPDPGGSAVILVIVSGTEDERSEHNPALDFPAESLST